VELFAYDMVELGYTFCESRMWTVHDTTEGCKDMIVRHSFSQQGNNTTLYQHTDLQLGGALVLISKRGSYNEYSVAGNSQEIIEKVWNLLGVGSEMKKRKTRAKAPTSIAVNFWTERSNFPRGIDTPTWKEIEGNYAGKTKETLGALMEGSYRPSTAGQLILWHGLPGTGKTYALRALGLEWRKWARVHYITDPDAFFGSSTYMLRVLLGDNAAPWDDELGDPPSQPSSEASTKGKPGDGWKLIVAEDTGELLAADAKQQTGQGLSRLLNIVDGMIGQGLRVCMLITTNEELQNLHPAVTRPGRCGALVDFQSFTPAEQKIWFDVHNKKEFTPTRDNLTVAEMYALAEGRQQFSGKPERKAAFV